LEPHLEAGRRREAAKRALAAEVIVGRMTLREAAGQLRRLDEAEPALSLGIPLPPRDEQVQGERVLYFIWESFMDQRQFAAGARWYGDTVTNHPHLFADSPTQHRYHAACAAARAGCGQGRDAANLDETSRAGFRRQARDWLRAELEARQRLLELQPEKALTAVGGLKDWLEDSAFAGVREPDALSQLPAAERQAWHKLWSDVADTLTRAVRRIPSAQRAGSAIPLPER
jgi:hypothetical protein